MKDAKEPFIKSKPALNDPYLNDQGVEARIRQAIGSGFDPVPGKRKIPKSFTPAGWKSFLGTKTRLAAAKKTGLLQELTRNPLMHCVSSGITNGRYWWNYILIPESSQASGAMDRHGIAVFQANVVRVADDRIVAISFFQDSAEGARLADSGDAGAQYILGLRYRDGLGVQKDMAEAYFWLSLSGARSHNHLQRAESLRAADDVSKTLTDEQLAAVQKRRLEWEPSGQ